MNYHIAWLISLFIIIRQCYGNIHTSLSYKGLYQKSKKSDFLTDRCKKNLSSNEEKLFHLPGAWVFVWRLLLNFSAWEIYRFIVSLFIYIFCLNLRHVDDRRVSTGCFLNWIMKRELSNIFHVQVHRLFGANAERGEVNFGIRVNTKSTVKINN